MKLEVVHFQLQTFSISLSFIPNAQNKTNWNMDRKKTKAYLKQKMQSGCNGKWIWTGKNGQMREASQNWRLLEAPEQISDMWGPCFGTGCPARAIHSRGQERHREQKFDRVCFLLLPKAALDRKSPALFLWWVKCRSLLRFSPPRVHPQTQCPYLRWDVLDHRWSWPPGGIWWGLQTFGPKLWAAMWLHRMVSWGTQDILQLFFPSKPNWLQWC